MPHLSAMDDEYDIFRDEGEYDGPPALDPMLVGALNARFEQALHLPPSTPARSMTAIERKAALKELEARAEEMQARATKPTNREPSATEGDEDHEQSE